VISNEARLILVVDRKSGLPLYFRYVAGNIVDMTTLKTMLAEMRCSGIDVDYAIVDAGYYSGKNIKDLQDDSIAFIMRMKPSQKLYKTLVATHAREIGSSKYLVKYQSRFLHIKAVKIDLFGKAGYAYVCQDDDLKRILEKEYYRDIYEEGIDTKKMDEAVNELGIFILVSSESILPRDLLPLYYTRQTVEQIFDIGKNNADLIPLRVHSVEAFRGHLLMSFIASYVYILVNRYFANTDRCAIGVFRTMKNQKCKVYDNIVLPQEPTKAMNEIYKTLKIEAAKEISR
jgi:transposase